MKGPLIIQGVSIDRTIAPLLARELELIIQLFVVSKSEEAEPIEKILVALHRLKGSSGFIGLKDIENQAREMEIKILETKSYHVEGVENFLKELRVLLEEINNAIR